jgi:hypothetical protein
MPDFMQVNLNMFSSWATNHETYIFIVIGISTAYYCPRSSGYWFDFTGSLITVYEMFVHLHGHSGNVSISCSYYAASMGNKSGTEAATYKSIHFLYSRTTGYVFSHMHHIHCLRPIHKWGVAVQVTRGLSTLPNINIIHYAINIVLVMHWWPN